MRSEELKQQICIAAGVECPQWLERIWRIDLLEELRDLVSASILIVSQDGPELLPIVPAYMPPQYLRRAIDIIKFLKR